MPKYRVTIERVTTETREVEAPNQFVAAQLVDLTRGRVVSVVEARGRRPLNGKKPRLSAADRITREALADEMLHVVEPAKKRAPLTGEALERARENAAKARAVMADKRAATKPTRKPTRKATKATK